MSLILLSIISYFLGSIPFSYLIAKVYRRNLYQVGSKNIGAANVWRATRKLEAFFGALVGDAGKGILAVHLAQKFFPEKILAQTLASFFVVAGHNWSIFLKFKGGKGLATLGGILLYLNWKALFLTLFLIGFSILLTELIMKKKIELKGTFKEKIKNLFQILISQVLGRVIGILNGAIFVLIFYPQVFKIAFPALCLVGIRHIKRTKNFLEGKIV